MPPEPFFSGEGIDRADALRCKPEAVRELLCSSEARELAWADGAPALDERGRLKWIPVSGEPELFLGLNDHHPRFARLPDYSQTPGDQRAHFDMLALLDSRDAPLFAAALSLANWHGRNRFCSACGRPTAANRGGWSRWCASCTLEHYPRVDPVVIMLAEHDGRLLLGRQPHYPARRYSALAGFVEPGESLEAAVARELREEAGIEVDSIRYIASQPWPFPGSLMIGAFARARDDRLTIDTTELEHAAWFGREEIIAALAEPDSALFLPPPPWAIARTLLEAWVSGLK